MEFRIGNKFCSSCGCNLEKEFIENPIYPRCYKPFTTGANHYPVYPKAPLVNRFFASFLDNVIGYGLAIPASLLYVIGLAQFENTNGSVFSIVLLIFAALFFLIPITYIFIKDGLGNGQSWGKKALGLMVVYLPTNTPCSKANSFFRALISGILTFIPLIGWLLEPIMVLATADGRRLADKIANTQVVSEHVFNNYYF